MPIIIENNVITSFQSFFNSRDLIKVTREELLEKPTRVINATYPALFVGEHEFAVLEPGQKDGLELIGSDEATTCNILIFRHSSNGVVCLGHLDGADTSHSVQAMFKAFKQASSSGPEGCYEMHLVGGFQDDRCLSINLTHDIIEAVCSLEDDVHLRTSCVFENNDVVKEGIHHPIVTGVGVDMATGEIVRVQFLDKGPDAVLRSASMQFRKISQIYKEGVLVVAPCYWQVNTSYYTGLLAKDDAYLLKRMSTSPEQESAHFIPAMRAQLTLLSQHGDSAKSIFSDGKARLYRWNGRERKWLRISN